VFAPRVEITFIDRQLVEIPTSTRYTRTYVHTLAVGRARIYLWIFPETIGRLDRQWKYRLLALASYTVDEQSPLFPTIKRFPTLWVAPSHVPVAYSIGGDVSLTLSTRIYRSAVSLSRRGSRNCTACKIFHCPCSARKLLPRVK